MDCLGQPVGERPLRSLALVFAAVALLVGCEVPPPDEPAEPLASIQQALCTPGSSCPNGAPCCGSFCCSSGEACCGGVCCGAGKCCSSSSCVTSSLTQCGSGSFCQNCDVECRINKACTNGTCTGTSVSDGTTCGAGATNHCCGGSCCNVATNCCSGGSCAAGTSVGRCGANGAACQNCDDGNPCTTDSCASGACGHAKVADQTPCPSGVCINGACCTGCVSNGTCVALGNQNATACGKNGAACGGCSDSNVCTQDRCVSGVCDFSLATSPGPVCRSSTGECDPAETCTGTVCPPNGYKPAGAGCSDDGNPCTTDACNSSGACVHGPVADNTPCTDNNVCSQGDSCQAGTCRPGAMIPCDDRNECTADTCDRSTGCVNTNRLDNTPCDDGNACTTGDKCTAGKCGGIGLDCNDNDPCT